MKSLARLLPFLGLVVVVAAVSAGICLWVAPFVSLKERRTHDWVHSKLNLTADQERALKPIEEQYATERARLEQHLHMANVQLADVIQRDKQDSENVHRAIEEIHSRMGDLQKVTIGHIFEMRKVLTPEQYDELLRLTANALREGDESSHDDEHR
ncbi:MAG: periplasmic heavy metal sensor [Chthoniobacterales bacterium]|nr:periplasmic heavy metal sensor [Chthoniobacterales bacterium]